MPVLKSLSFTALPKTTNDPVQQRRTKFITKLGRAEAAPEGPQARPNRPAMDEGQRGATGHHQAAGRQALVED
jgi:hypothetical protein